MPFASNAGVRVFWRLEGAAERPVVLLLNSIGTDLSLWDRVAPLLLPRLRLLRMDTRGHGASDAPPGDYRVEDLAADAVAVLDAAQVREVAVCGVSLGGMTALTLALAAPTRVRAVICACSAAALPAPDWTARVRQIREHGVGGIVDLAMGRLFSEPFSRAHPEITGGVRAGLERVDPIGYSGCAAAIRDFSLIDRLGAIGQPLLLISGTRDVATPFDPYGAQLLAAIPGARHVSLEAGHLPCLEAPGAFSAAVRDFLDQTLPPAPHELTGGAPDEEPLRAAAATLYEAGLAVRREVLGDAWVERALAGRTDFNADFQAMITRTAWQEVWSRPGLERRTRRLLVLAITVALGRWEEFRLHVRSGLTQGGFSAEELKEVLMQSALYAGVPAANTAFAEAAAILRELGSGP